jgi:hypothetical protein
MQENLDTVTMNLIIEIKITAYKNYHFHIFNSYDGTNIINK